jgi:rhamnosyltransferase
VEGLEHRDSKEGRGSFDDRAVVVAIVATHNPSTLLIENIAKLLEQTHQVVVIDDASTSASSLGVLEELRHDRLTVLRLDANGGIARSLNYGVNFAADLQAEFVLTMDQDTLVPDGYVSRVASYIQYAEKAGLQVGLATAGVMNGRTRNPRRTVQGLDVGIDVMQSGCVYRLSTLLAIGKFREDFIIDGVDTEYCLRLRRAGLRNIWVPDTNLEHSVGETQVARFLGRPVSILGRELRTSHHANFRRYYMIRNRIVLYRDFATRDIEWLRHALPRQLRDNIFAVLFEPGRRQRMRALLMGCVDGLANRTGHLESLHPRFERR